MAAEPSASNSSTEWTGERAWAALNAGQKAFVLEYLKDHNGRQAAIRAGYAARSAEVQASKLLRNPKVEAALAMKMAEREKRTEVTADKVVQELAAVAFLNPWEFLERDETGAPVLDAFGYPRWDIEALREGCGRGVVEISKHADGTTKLKFGNKLRALEALGRHLGMFRDRQELSGPNGGALEYVQKAQEGALAALKRAVARRRQVNEDG